MWNHLCGHASLRLLVVIVFGFKFAQRSCFPRASVIRGSRFDGILLSSIENSGFVHSHRKGREGLLSFLLLVLDFGHDGAVACLERCDALWQYPEQFSLHI